MTEAEVRARIITELERSPEYDEREAIKIVEAMPLLGVVIMLVGVIVVDSRYNNLLPVLQEAADILCKERQNVHSIALILREFIRD